MKNDRVNILAPLVVSLILSFSLYANSLNGDFVSDDKLVISQNPLVSGNPADFIKALSVPYYYNQPHAGLYRPLTIASYNFNKFFNSKPFGFHFVNVILNAINGFFVFLVVSKLISRRSAYVAMILFMLLPIHTEAVSSIVGRAELLAFLLSVSSLLFILEKRYVLASAVFLLALLSKETAVGFFLVFLYLWKFSEHQTFRQVFYRSLYFIPSVAVYAIMRAFVLGKYFVGVDHLMAYNPLKFTPFFDSLWTSFRVFYLYIFKTVMPYQLSSDYSFNQISIIKNPFLHYEVYAGVIILAAIMYLAVKKRNTIYGLAAAMFLLTYLPISNWFFKIGTIMGERLMYAPSLGLVTLVSVLINKHVTVRGPAAPHPIGAHLSIARLRGPQSRHPFLIYFCITLLLFWYSYVIVDRNRDWKNEPTLLTSGYEASPNSVVSITSMGILEFGNENYREAGKWAEKALAIEPNHVPALFIVGHAHKNLGNLKSAELSWLKLVEISPNYVTAYLSLGSLYYEQGQFGKAELAFKKGFELEKTWSKAFPLILVKINLGKYDEAIQLIINNFGSEPQKKEIKFALGLAYLKKGDEVKAEFYLSQVKDPSVSIEDYVRKVRDQKTFKINEY